MLNTIFGKKKNMGHMYVGDTRVSVTNIEAGPCVVTQVKTVEKDGYHAVQLGFDTRKLKTTTKALQGHLKGAISDKKAPYFLREVRSNEDLGFKVGDIVSISDVFKKGDIITVTATSKGKGFQGAVKRHGFAGGPKTHGQSDRHRAPGSIGQGTTPGRVLKGKRMAGRMGSDTITIKNLTVIDFDKEKNIVRVSGSIPGSPGTYVKLVKIADGNLSDLEEEVPQVVAQVENAEEGSKEETKTEEKAE